MSQIEAMKKYLKSTRLNYLLFIGINTGLK
ncbi:site-specific integrase, partial [Bacillus thuringiensis]